MIRRLGTLIAFCSILACGTAVEMSSLPDGVANSGADSHSTTLGHYQMVMDTETATYALVPETEIQNGLAELFMAPHESLQKLATTISGGDLTLTNSSTTVYEYDQNRFTIMNFNVKNTNTDANHYHYTNFELRSSLFNPSSTLITDFEGDDPGTYSRVSFQSIPYNNSVERGIRVVNTAGASRIAFSITFDATLTTTAPTEYIKTSAVYLWPISGSIGTFPIIGAGFGASPTLKVGGTTVSYTSSSSTQINRNYTGLPNVTGIMTVDNGATTINGPEIISGTRGSGNIGLLPNGDGDITGTLWVMVWNGSGTPDVDHCPPTSNLGSWDEESVQLTLSDQFGVAGQPLMNFIGVSGSGYQVEVIFDRNRNGRRDSGDYYAVTSGVTITANSAANTLINPTFTSGTTITATCP